MTPFASSAQLASWAGLCPGNNRSADRNLGTRCNKGNQWLCTTLAECAWAASMQNGSIFQARFQRLAPRIGRRAAVVAVAHAMLIAVYHVLQTGQPYSKGAARIAPTQKHRLIRHHFRCLRRLGVNPIAESIIAADSAPRVPEQVLLQHRRFPARSPGAAAVRALAQSAFVDEDDRAAFFLRFFLIAGQVLRFHSTMASSFRSGARPFGRCGLQFNWRKSFHTWPA